MTDREKVLEIAKACGDDIDNTLPSDIDFLCVFYRAVRNEAFEQAAEYVGRNLMSCREYEDAIRALKEK